MLSSSRCLIHFTPRKFPSLTRLYAFQKLGSARSKDTNTRVGESIPPQLSNSLIPKEPLGDRHQLLNYVETIKQRHMQGQIKEQEFFPSPTNIESSLYADTGLLELKNLLQQLDNDEVDVLRSHGLDRDTLDQELEIRQKELAAHFSFYVAGELAKHASSHIKKLKDTHKQSTSAASALQQTLKNANVPESVISSSVAVLHEHLAAIQQQLIKWEKVKGDVDLLLSTRT